MRIGHGNLSGASEAKTMKNDHCVYVQRGRDDQGNLKWRVGMTTRPDKRPQESYRENKDCLGELEQVNLICGLDEETTKALELVLMDMLQDIAPEGKCNLRHR
ncbi:MAG: hypothetical protein HQ578_00015 [Chloroflexi bacterium]|nr:hypothetical protein [Chloroflexota bacterium]